MLAVMLGMHRIEVVPHDTDSVQYRMAMGRLVNAGWEVTALAARLGHDTRTLRGWAEALLCADPAEMIRRLSGRGAEGKVTSTMVAFALDWWEELRGRVRNFRRRILAKVERVFRVGVSWEALRPALLARRRQRSSGCCCEAADEVCAEDRAEGGPEDMLPVTDAEAGLKRSRAPGREADACGGILKA